MTYKTRGIVLRNIKYGETSLVVTVFTQLFGVQTYMVNGVRTAKKPSSKANYFQPTALLDLVVYHHENKTLQRIKEFEWAVIYKNILSDVIKNSIGLYMMELLHKCLKQPEVNDQLFQFCEKILLQLDASNKKAAANFSLFFTLRLAHFSGFGITNNYSEQKNMLDLQEGCFVNHQPNHPHFITGEQAALTSQLLRITDSNELEKIQSNRLARRELLLNYQQYYSIHVPGFGQMKTLIVLNEVL